MKKTEFLATIEKMNNDAMKVFAEMVAQIEDGKEEQEEMMTISKSTFKNLVNEIVNNICEEGVNLVDDYELSISYNSLSLDDVSFNEYKVQDIIESSLESYFNVDEE